MLTNTSMTAVCDAVAADLQSLALPTHGLWKYVKPHALRADQGPWLSVFADNVVPTLQSTTSDYYKELVLGVWWSVPVYASVESNTYTAGMSPNLAAVALAGADLVNDRLLTYGGGIPGLQVTARVEHVEMGEVNGAFWESKAQLIAEMWT